jgi:hypothetical protein
VAVDIPVVVTITATARRAVLAVAIDTAARATIDATARRAILAIQGRDTLIDTYERPGGGEYRRPDGTSTYERP